MSDNEVYYNTKIRTIRNQLVHGFAPREDIHLPENLVYPTVGVINAIVMEFLQKQEILKLFFPGELMATSNPVSVKVSELANATTK